MKAFWDNGVVTDPVIVRHSAWQRRTHTEWYPPGTPEVPHRRTFDPAVVGPVLGRVDAMLFFETPFDWSLLPYCRDAGIKTALMPMYEWFPHTPPSWPDLMLCPSLLDLDYFKDRTETRAVFLPVPVDPSRWRMRTKAERFLHNAGNVGHREHKGTRQLLEAVRYVRSPDFRLTVRAQDTRALRDIARGTAMITAKQALIMTRGSATVEATDPRVTFEFGERPYETLWDDHDVYVAPEKLNGLSLPLQESYAAGMMLLTTDRYPANTWAPKEGLIPVSEYRRERIAGSYLEFDEAVVRPEAIAAKIDEWVGRDLTYQSKKAHCWANDYSWDDLRPRYLEVFEDLCR